MFTVSGTHESAWSPAGRQLGREDGGDVGRAGTRWNNKHKLSPTVSDASACSCHLDPLLWLWVSAKHTPGPQEPERLKVEQELLIRWKWSRLVVSDSFRPLDCSPPGSSVHGIVQARILEWVAISFSRVSFWPRDWTQVSRIAGRCFNLWATREAHLSDKRTDNSSYKLVATSLPPSKSLQSLLWPPPTKIYRGGSSGKCSSVEPSGSVTKPPQLSLKSYLTLIYHTYNYMPTTVLNSVYINSFTFYNAPNKWLLLQIFPFCRGINWKWKG